ncbi:unnamed protein product [Rotaria magnacalcarata]|nr:unnamed protein product [Rotaria magnacalcarata]CAF1643834.1 unnamed protein product [Rotaria magnacalcarata]CAF2155573.1 unnamed protein product [Rotaria magnacalcarata]CAF2268878.1 unnamed protein product [Rotaria magnacalcarata]
MSTIFIVSAIIFFILNIRFLVIDRRRLNPFALNLIINALISISFTLPYIAIQAIHCHPIQEYIVCHLQAFICFTCGICVMYTVSLLAVVQYIRLFYNSSILHKIFEHKNNFLIPAVCWLISLMWSFPPFINIKPGFKREGKGFDCGINWGVNDLRSCLYILLVFLFIYFLPLFCLIYTNMRILKTIRKLIYRRNSLRPKATVDIIPRDSRHHFINVFTVAESNRLKRLRIDRKFAQAVMITVIHYLLAWTPYATCAIIQLATAMTYIQYQVPPMLIAGSALLAKMAIMGQSCVYFYTVRSFSR